MYCAAAPSYHDFLRHLFADGNARLLDVDYNISAQGVDYLYSAADDKSEIFEMLFYFRAAAYLLDDILFADLCEHQRHHIESLFLFCISGISIR